MPNAGYFDVSFATSGTKTTVPDAVQPDGTVSYTQGYGPDYLLQPGTPNALDVQNYEMNQLFYDITSAIQQYQQFGTPPFITTAMNNGSPYSYPQYARVLYSGVVYQSLVASNTDTPPSSKWKVTDGRIRLSTATTFYVATTGNDTTGNGTVGNPWATANHAYAYIQANYDLAGFAVTIQHADGTYTTGLTANGPLVGAIGSGSCILNGNSGTPSNVLYSTTGSCISSVYGGSLTIQNLKCVSSAGYGLSAQNADSDIAIGTGMVFGACSAGHMLATSGGNIELSTNYTISGNATSHWQVLGSGSNITGTARTITLTGTPAFTQFALSATLANISVPSFTFSGSATGSRYNVLVNAAINTNGGGASYLPGNAGGTTSTGGQYV